MKFVVDGYQITRTDHESVITTSNVESVVCEFEFANTYTDQLFAVMYRDKTLNRMVEIQNGSCVIPWELLETEGMLYIGACALSTQGPAVLKRTTSNAAAVRIQKSLYYDTVLNAMPTPELWEQIVGYRNETQEFAEQAADDAESAAQSAQHADSCWENAGLAADEAYGYAEQAGESAGAAGQSAQSAASSAALAEQAKADAQTIKDSTEIFYDVQTNKVGFRRADEENFTYTGDLTGPQGVQGEQGPRGLSGVYVGSGEMPEGYNVQIDPDGSGSCYMAAESDSRYAPAITGEATGTLVTLSDAWAGGVLQKCEVQGRSSQIVTQQGKNLFDVTEMSCKASSGSAYEILENSTIRVAVSLAGTYRYVSFTTLAFDHLKGQEITVSTDAAFSGANDGHMAIQFLTDGTSIANQYIKPSTGFRTFTVPEAFDEVKLVFYANAESAEGQVGDTATYANIQIETGNTRTDYEPFVPNSPSPDYPAQISGITPARVSASSKNLLNPALLSSNNVVTCALQGDGTLILNGSNDSTNTTIQHPSHPIYLPAGEYRLSLNTVSGTYSSPSDVIYFGMRKSDGTTALSNQITNSVTSKSFRFVSAGLYYYFYMVGVFTCTDWRISIQLEPGTVTTAYEPYTGAEYTLPELEPLYSLSDGICDTYDAATGTETRRIGVITLDGTENWGLYDTAVSDKKRMGLYIPNVWSVANANILPKMICTHYQTTTPEKTWNCLPGITVNISSNPFLAIYDDQYNYADITAWKSWLSAQQQAGTPVTLLYRLAEPVITQHDPIAVTVPAPTTNISADAGEVNITYTKDTGRVIAALTERIAALEGGNNA